MVLQAVLQLVLVCVLSCVSSVRLVCATDGVSGCSAACHNVYCLVEDVEVMQWQIA